MGASNGGIGIKMDTSDVDIGKVVEDLFGKEYVKCQDSCDTRDPGCVYVTKKAGVLSIINTALANKFFQGQSTEPIKMYIDYFGVPELIFAFEQYDSGDTYSYSLIYKGVLKRQFRSVIHKKTIDYGELEAIEVDWKNAEVSNFDLGDGEFETNYTNRKTGFLCSEDNLPSVILDQLLFEKLGFDAEPTTIIEKSFFRRNESNGKPWWRIW